MTLEPQRTPTAAEVVAATNRPIPRGIRTTMLVCTIIGVLVFIIGLFLAPDRVWRAFHANWLLFGMSCEGAAVIVAVQRITTARWSRSTVRFLEGFTAFLPIAFIFLVLTFAFGRNYVFPWTHEAYPAAEKAIYYNPAFETVRDLVIYGLMTWLALWLVYGSLRLDVGHLPEWGADWAAGIRARMRARWRGERREIHSTHSLHGKIAVWMVVLFGLGGSVLAWDLSMGLTLHFQSTLYGWWFFMGAWLNAIALFGIMVLIWDRFLGSAGGLIARVNYHDIGKLVFAFTAFWGYLTFGQYLVIWYGNMGEETWFMRLRLIPPWEWITVTSVILIFVAPFFGFLSQAAKEFKPTFLLFTLCSAVGMWLMRYIEMYPSGYGVVSSAPIGVWEAGVTLLYVGLFGVSYIAFFDAFPRMRVTMLTSPYRDEIQVPVNPETMEPLPAHE